MSKVETGLATLLPDDWWRLPAFPIGADECEKFDEAFASGYLSAASELDLEKASIAQLWRQAQPFTDIDQWRATIRQTCEELNGSILADLLYPAEGGDFLLYSGIEGASTEELASIVMEWRHRFLPYHRASMSWTTDRVQICFDLLLRPQTLRRKPWESSLAALVTDRVTARAIAFLAWRIGQFDYLHSLIYEKKPASDGS
ncbi:hypothetical protein [Thalassoglobus sp.]|uniref:hypothetical protein n=1 Tax=Thalassoglobus sp. TaxID=2795869 RepID=UPI003AA955F8